ncbi:MAG: type II toxin-antitoxin system death-on-curing family toxin [Piscirickettsiaceae bacterium]|nr:MAG: type II toxin-antitoxin system death-on-curing family toxin [Piscirickettsiaceae bacterium]
MNEPLWVIDKVVLATHSMLLAEHGGDQGLRDEKLLVSALARPKNKFNYEPNSTVCELAASYSVGLAKNHPFIDGNKRIALTVALIFLEINGFSLSAAEPETAIVFEQLAASKVSEQDLAIWFQKNTHPAT